MSGASTGLSALWRQYASSYPTGGILPIGSRRRWWLNHTPVFTSRAADVAPQVITRHARHHLARPERIATVAAPGLS